MYVVSLILSRCVSPVHGSGLSPFEVIPAVMEYSAAFTAGALLHQESVQVIAAVQEHGDLQAADPDVLTANSKRARERKTREVVRRLQQMERSVWRDFLDDSVAEQKMTLYYGVLKTYRLLFDFHMDVVLPRWRSLDRRITPHDARRFLERRADQHPELDTWSPSTWQKVRQVMLKMLSESGLLYENTLQAPALPDAYWHRFVRVGDIWFLEAALLNERTRTAILEAATS